MSGDEDLRVVSDYVDGARCSELLRMSAPPAVELMVRILIDVLSGLSALHNLRDAKRQPLKLVHGELTPDCIVVSTEGVARLVGICRPRSATRRDFGEGNRYLAPEVLLADATADARIDVYSVGVLLVGVAERRAPLLDDAALGHRHAASQRSCAASRAPREPRLGKATGRRGHASAVGRSRATLPVGGCVCRGAAEARGTQARPAGARRGVRANGVRRSDSRASRGAGAWRHGTAQDRTRGEAPLPRRDRRRRRSRRGRADAALDRSDAGASCSRHADEATAAATLLRVRPRLTDARRRRAPTPVQTRPSPGATAVVDPIVRRPPRPPLRRR